MARLRTDARPNPRKGVRIPKSGIYNSRRDKTGRSKRKKTDKTNVVRGAEVSITESSSARQLIYGQMRVGGVITFVETSADSKAYLVTGQDDYQIAWIARAGGADGNVITITIVIRSGNHSDLPITVVGNDITIQPKTVTGVSNSTVTQVIAAVAADSAANALVSGHRVQGSGLNTVLASAQANLANGGGTWLHTVHTIAGHKIDAIDTIYLDERPVTFGGTPDPRWGTGIWANKMFLAPILGDDDQEAQGDLMGQIPAKWTSNHRQRGCAGAYIIEVYNANLYTEGFPRTEFLVRGKPVYDPRTGQTAWIDTFSKPIGQNAALCVADFLTTPRNRGGFGVDWADIDITALETAANICEQEIDLLAGGTEWRYKVNGAVDVGNPDEILQQLLDAMAGELVTSGETIKIVAGAYYVPTVTITRDMIVGPISITTHVSSSESFNCCRATYVDPSSDYQETDAPVIKNSTYITEDGGEEVFHDLALNFVTSPGQAQRLCKIELERVRQGQTINIPTTLEPLDLTAKDTVEIVLPEFGIDKVYDVREINFVLGDDGSCTLEIQGRENASGIWEWNSGEETTVDLSANTTLPDPRDVSEPENLVLTSGTAELYIRQDGVVFSRLKAAWDASSTEFVTNGGFFELQYKKTADATWSHAIDVPGETLFYHILDVQDGTSYDVRIRAGNALGYFSDWLEVDGHTVVGKTAPPSDVTGLAAVVNSFGVDITCNAITDLDADVYEFRYTQSGQAWADATQIAPPARSTHILWKHQVAGDYRLLVKAYDTSGNPSTNADTFDFTITAPSAPTVTLTLDGADLLIEVTESSAEFAIKEYEFRYGLGYDTGTTLAVITGRKLRIPVTWGGARSFFVAARDIADNTGAAGSSAITINNPNPVRNFSPAATQNTILLDWDEPTAGSLPIATYFVYKGDTFATAERIGNVPGTFNTYVEDQGGTFTYWVVAVDTAGNVSSEVSADLTVALPDNFFIRDDTELTPYKRDSRKCILGGSAYAPDMETTKLLLPVASTVTATAGLPILFNTEQETFDTWAAHFGTYTTFQAMIDAGFDVFPMPGTTDPGYCEFVIDYAVTFDESFIDFTWDEEVLAGSVTIIPTISTSPDGTTWTDHAGAQQVFGDNFRYVKYRIDFTGADAMSMSILSNIRARLSLKIEEEYGTAAVLSTDVGGTVVTFVKDFLDVRDIQVTPQTSSAAFVTQDFVDIPNPVSFPVFLWDKDGNRVSGTVSYRVIGAVNPS